MSSNKNSGTSTRRWSMANKQYFRYFLFVLWSYWVHWMLLNVSKVLMSCQFVSAFLLYRFNCLEPGVIVAKELSLRRLSAALQYWRPFSHRCESIPRTGHNPANINMFEKTRTFWKKNAKRTEQKYALTFRFFCSYLNMAWTKLTPRMLWNRSREFFFFSLLCVCVF